MLRRLQPLCPYCREPLDVSWDMWGQFYVCEECGFAVDDDRALEVKLAAALRSQEELSVYRGWFVRERR